MIIRSYVYKVGFMYIYKVMGLLSEALEIRVEHVVK